jgi:alpha-galactosidase
MLGWFSLMLDANEWTAEQRNTARQEFALYKTELRPLIREADLYHVAPRPDGVHWDGMEYYSAKLRRGVLYAFRGSADRRMHQFHLLGLNPGSRYRVRFHDQASTQVRSGEALMQAGVDVALPLPLSSELIFIEEIS